VCLRGASGVEKALLQKQEDKSLRAYVVWVPMLGGEEKHVPVATRLVPDPRATHFWDESGVTIEGYRLTLELPEPAWDIYMVYDRGARWDGELPPKPDFWMHQLGSRDSPRVKGPYLHPDTFAAKVSALLEKR
jgi:hypothetical protein